MGMYLNSKTPYTLYKKEVQKSYFVDKSMLLLDLIRLIESGGDYLCITRPRRFGKTVAANMISAYFSKGIDASSLFEGLEISKKDVFRQYMNQYSVIHIQMNDMIRACDTFDEYIRLIERQLVKDLSQEYPMCNITEKMSGVEALLEVYNRDVQFIFVLDEWDFIFHQSFATEADKRKYLLFLRNLLKDRPYVLFAYMTGILPIAKYSSGSELNMFREYTMVSEAMFSDYFGFTEKEVDTLYERYLQRENQPNVTREGLREWYNGYHTKSGERLYNPRSVVMSLTNNNLGNYWTSAGPYDEIFYYVEHNVDAVRDDLACMVSGLEVPIRIQEYAATASALHTREEIFSAMVVYGFLSYENGKLSIPNRELMNKFNEILQQEKSLGYVYRLANASDRMLQATLAGDTATMERILELVHNTETPLLNYNHETELTAIVNLIYLGARDFYRIEREDKAGAGFVDFIFYPELDKSADAIILELKVDDTPENAINQIKQRQYMLKLKGRIAEEPRYTGNILLVGIGYDKKTKKHRCLIEKISN